MTILVDIDGVIFNTQETLLNFLNNRYNTNYTLNDITSYDWFDKTFKEPWNLMKKPEFWYAVNTNPEAIKYIAKWLQEGHTVKIVTASHFHHGIYSKMSKLKRDFGGVIRDEDVIICHDKEMIRGNLLIDDCVDNCKKFNNNAILFAQPWNNEESVKDAYCVFRTNDWKEIDTIVKYLSE